MALDPNQLRRGLEEYRATLALQRSALQSRYVELQRQFNGLFNVYGGAMAEDFRQRWSRTANWFEEYLNKNAALDQFLQERIEQLRQL
jgi:hypothetical protein